MGMVTVYLEDGTVVGEGRGTRKNPGEDYSFSADDVCKVEPTNALKKKHRGRICRFTGTYREYGPGTLKIGAIFLDTGKLGYVDAGDLIPVPPDEVAAQPHQ